MPNRCEEIKQEKQPQVAESYMIKQKVFANFAGKVSSCSQHICMPFLLLHLHILSLIHTQISCPNQGSDRTREEK